MHFCIACDCFLLQSQSQVLAREHFWSVRQKIFTIKPFTEKCSAITLNPALIGAPGNSFSEEMAETRRLIGCIISLRKKTVNKTHTVLSLLVFMWSQSVVTASIKMKNSIEENTFCPTKCISKLI